MYSEVKEERDDMSSEIEISVKKRGGESKKRDE
jgi:hypothetical protein